MFVIAGVSGNTGSAAAQALLESKREVRVLVRDAQKGAAWRERGAQVAVTDLADVDGLAKALTGATGAYLLLPPFGFAESGFAQERRALADGIVEAVRRAKPKHVVFLSSVGAQHASGTGPIAALHSIEQGLARSGVPSTFLRAAYFMENWAASVPSALAAGALYNGLKADLKIPQVATLDIGRTAAKLLAEPVAGGTRVVELAGPEEYSLIDTARILSQVSGKTIEAVSVPLAAMKDALRGMGASNDVAEIYAEMTGAINDGKVAWERGSALSVRGEVRLATVLEGFARRTSA